MAEPAVESPATAPAPLTWFGRLDAAEIPAPFIARLIVGGVFILLGWQKVTEPVVFLKAIKSYGILPLEPPVLLNAMAVILPWIEIVTGLLLILGRARRGGAVIALAMLSVFTVAIFILAMSKLPGMQAKDPTIGFFNMRLDCGCGSGEVNVAGKLAMNLGLIALSAWLVASKSRRWIARPFL